jgi:hypothetical protein
MPETQDDDIEDGAYRWAMAALYTFAIVANIWIVAAQLDPTEREMIAVRIRRCRTVILSPWTKRARFRRHANAVIYDAIQTVEAASAE